MPQITKAEERILNSYEYGKWLEQERKKQAKKAIKKIAKKLDLPF